MHNRIQRFFLHLIAIAFVASVILFIPTLAISQRVTWLQSYNSENNDFFYDLFQTDDGGLVACGISKDFMNSIPRPGRPLIIRLNADHEVVWQRSYGNEYTSILRSIIETDAGELLIAGERNAETPGHGEFSAMKLAANGDVVWWRTYGPGAGYAAIELKGGEYILAGFSEDNGTEVSRLIRINNNGEIVWSRTYSPGSSCFFVGVRETPGETVVAGGRAGSNAWLVKASQENGAQVWSQNHNDRILAEAMISTGDGGFLLVGKPASGAAVGKYNSQGQQVFYRTYNLNVERKITDGTFGVARLSNGGFAICGHVGLRAVPVGNYIIPYILRINRFGDELSQTFYETAEWGQNYGGRGTIGMFFSIIRNSEDELIACGTVTDNSHGGDYNNDALFIQFESDVPPPPGIEYFPLDTILTFLPNAVQRFWIRAVARPAGDFDYVWLYRDTVRANTSDCNIRFRNRGNFEVSGCISEGEWGREIHWQVEVTDMFISDNFPDSLNLIARRGSTQDFGIEITATQNDTLAPSIEWQLTDLTDNRSAVVAADTNNATVRFDRTGPHRVTALAWRGETTDRADWNVDVRGVIRTYVPESNLVNVQINDSVDFQVTPFNPQSDSLTYCWTLDGDTVGQDSAIVLAFSEVGNYEVAVVAYDGAEADSQSWSVMVVRPEGVDEFRVKNYELRMSVVPNPFNSMAEIQYSLPKVSDVSVRLYDISGRGILTLMDEKAKPAGDYSLTLDGRELPAGIYYLRLESAGRTEVAKVALIK